LRAVLAGRDASSAVANGVRAAVATLVPFFLAATLGHAELAWMALGGWLGTLADPGGLRSTRIKVLASFALLGAAIVPLSEQSGRATVAATLFLAVVAFAGTLARALGPGAATVGTMLAIVAAVGSGRTGTTTPLADGLLFAAGAAWATLLSSIVWHASVHRPVRRATARVYGAMSAYASSVAAAAVGADAGATWTALALTHHRRIRSAMEEALAIALAVRADRPGESALGADLRVLLGMADAQFPRLIALSVELEATPVRERPAAVIEQLHVLADTYEAIERALLTPETSAGHRPARPAAEEASTAAAVHAARLAEASEHARSLAESLGRGVSMPPEQAPRERARAPSALVTVRQEARELADAVSFESVFFRHALRVAAAVTVASVVGHRIAVHRNGSRSRRSRCSSRIRVRRRRAPPSASSAPCWGAPSPR
jgi:hypothetical protein